ncbi:fused MFS/spermidine synthase [Montanilutibacter psychrotolerans]|nr:fused MFS/spermidine synthase [Lysobacter psychrotolerans]
MSNRRIGLERTLLALFVASGFAGLVYQSIWSHYLGLSLGHAAYAQSLVLAIFMGGMALGAWAVSRFGSGWGRLILAYAWVEIVIGLAGLAFHPLFEMYTTFSQDTVYPAMSSEAAVRAWQWGSAAMMILPQSILLGMTFPLMSGGYLRVAPRADGEILGGLYFTNSIGAAIGALAATFVLLPAVGMPGSVMVAGLVNLAVGGLAWVVARHADQAAPVPVAPVSSSTADSSKADSSKADPAGGAARLAPVLMLAAAITGATSFVYEIGWVRMLNQALGTTVHSFELMLAAFILGLAFGGWWIRNRSQRLGDAIAYAGYAQIWMGAAALVSLPVFGQSFRWVAGLMAALPRDPSGYAMFSLGSGGIALLVMFPAAFFAGMTLPLYTMALLRRGGGEASIGRIYAANTLGAIVGVVVAVHVLIPMLGLRLAVTIAALIDIVLGVVLLRFYAEQVRKPRYLAAVAVAVVAFAGSMLLGRVEPRALVSGVFRHGLASLGGDATVHYLRDGKTATVGFFSVGSVGTIATNGKPDASIEIGTDQVPTDDEITMAMAAALPLATHPDPRKVAIIGWGSGLSTHTMLGSPLPEVVDSIEIERAMYDGARMYGRRVARAYNDPRSRIHIDDARTYFSTGQRRYDVIISEPSNPWVSGVASLFTSEFYEFMHRHLEDDGIAVQWLQSYELSDPLVATMVSALVNEFDYVDAYLTNTSDMLFVASGKPIPAMDAKRLSGEPLKSELARIGIRSGADLQVRQIASRSTLQAYVAMEQAVPHSDFYPTVSLQAPRTRFMHERVVLLEALTGVGMPLLEMTGGRSPLSIADDVTENKSSFGATDHTNARSLRDAMNGGTGEGLRARRKDLLEAVKVLRGLSASPVASKDMELWMRAVAGVADSSIGYLPADDHVGIWLQPEWIDLKAQPPMVVAVMDAYAAAARRNGPAMRETGLQALQLVGNSAPSVLREQMLVISILGAIAQGDRKGAVEIESKHGANVASERRYALARSFLLAWNDVAPSP